MSTPANAAYKQVQRRFRERADTRFLVYAPAAYGGRPGYRKVVNGKVQYVPLPPPRLRHR